MVGSSNNSRLRFSGTRRAVGGLAGTREWWGVPTMADHGPLEQGGLWVAWLGPGNGGEFQQWPIMVLWNKKGCGWLGWDQGMVGSSNNGRSWSSGTRRAVGGLAGTREWWGVPTMADHGSLEQGGLWVAWLGPGNGGEFQQWPIMVLWNKEGCGWLGWDQGMVGSSNNGRSWSSGTRRAVGGLAGTREWWGVPTMANHGSLEQEGLWLAWLGPGNGGEFQQWPIMVLWNKEGCGWLGWDQGMVGSSNNGRSIAVG